MTNFFKISFPYSRPFEFFLILELTSQFSLKLGRVFSRKLETFNGKRNFILKTKIFLKTVTFFVKIVFYPSVRFFFPQFCYKTNSRRICRSLLRNETKNLEICLHNSSRRGFLAQFKGLPPNNPEGPFFGRRSLRRAKRALRMNNSLTRF